MPAKLLVGQAERLDADLQEWQQLTARVFVRLLQVLGERKKRHRRGKFNKYPVADAAMRPENTSRFPRMVVVKQSTAANVVLVRAERPAW